MLEGKRKFAGLDVFAVLCLIAAGLMPVIGLTKAHFAERDYAERCKAGRFDSFYLREANKPLSPGKVSFLKRCVEDGYLSQDVLDRHAIW